MERLPEYLRLLTESLDAGVSNVSSEELADMAGVNAAKVRKDLSYLGTYGVRGVGYDVEYLIYQVRRELGLDHDWPVVIVGAGNLGQALAGYGGFGQRGFPIAGIVDVDPGKVGMAIGDVTVRDLDRAGDDRAQRPRLDRCRRHAARRRPGRGRTSRLGRGHEHPQLRPGPAQRAAGGVGPQGRPRRRAPDPELLRAAPRVVRSFVGVAPGPGGPGVTDDRRPDRPNALPGRTIQGIG